MTQEVERLFDLLADLDAAARKSYFAAHNTEPVIQREVESLLAHDRTSTATLVMPIAELAASGLPDASAAAGTRCCGPYALVQLIGRGGMGTVFRGERVDGEVHQQVAIKLMCGDCRDPQQRQRFLQERQILATLSHPNIASLLDAGHDADGQPYLVMELVEGRPIDEFREELATRQKIELFLQVCDAVSFAHSRLVVHRDIKPGNILVTAGGVPKLLDFGIAKMLGFDAGVTLAWQRVMTPVYGSPEQAAGGEVTTASDTYSLGAVLYKMLTGHAPYEMDGATPEAMLEAVRTHDVPRASRWKPELRGDLDAILARALRKEPQQRYTTVEQLSSDLRRYLEWMPIRAREGEFLYRTGKFLRRSWIPLTAALIVIAALAAGLAVAQRARQLAEKRFRIARDLAGDLFGVEDRVRSLQGSVGARQYIADKALRYLDDLSREASERDLLLELAEAYRRTANVLSRRGESSLGRDADAFAALNRGYGLLGKALAARPNDGTVLRAMIENRLDNLTLLTDKDQRTRNAELIRELASLVGKFTARNTGAPDLKLAAIAYVGIRRALSGLDRNEESRRYAELSVEYSRRYAEAARTPEAYLQYGAALRSYASFLRYAGQLEQSLAALEEALHAVERLPESKRQQNELSALLYYIGQVNLRSDSMGLDRPAAAIAALERSVTISRRLMSADPKDHNARVDFAQSELRLAGLIRETHPAGAIPLLDEAWEVMRAEPKGSFLRAEYLIRVAAESTYALRAMGRNTEARRRLAQIRTMFYPDQGPESLTLTSSSPADALLQAEADMDAATGNPRAAIETYRLLLRKYEERGYRPQESLTDALALSTRQGRLMHICRQAGDPSAADAYAGERLALWRHWNQRLPDNSLIIRELADAQNKLPGAH
jgi:predicted Ser/Thr protein kinase